MVARAEIKRHEFERCRREQPMPNFMSVSGVATVQQEYAIIGAQAGGLRA